VFACCCHACSSNEPSSQINQNQQPRNQSQLTNHTHRIACGV
jgi:hypothetical protein